LVRGAENGGDAGAAAVAAVRADAAGWSQPQRADWAGDDDTCS